MSYDTLYFVFFLALVWTAFVSLPGKGWILLAASIAFYSAAGLRDSLLATAIILVNYAFQFPVKRDRRWLWLALAINFGCLIYFKYRVFLATAAGIDFYERGEAVIRDLSAISRDNKLPVVLVMRNIGLGCERIADARKALTDAIEKRLAAAGLGFADFDALLLKKNGSPSVERLHGFGKNLGTGHLNIEGNRVYGEILAEIIASRPEWRR